MKRLITAGLATAAIAGPLVGAGTAHADNYQDVQFLALLEAHGVQANMLGIPMAHGVCNNINAYRYSSGLWPATEYAIRQVYNTTDYSMTWDLSSWFTASAVVVYCPWNQLPDNSGTEVL